MSDPKDTGVGRREFVGTAAAAATLTILKPSLVFGTQANSAVRMGILGCGGRGLGVMSSFLKNTSAVVTAAGDMFQDNLDAGKKRLDEVSAGLGKPAIDPSRLFRGSKAYEQLFTSKDVDALYVATPPYFHPAHLEAAIASGKHIYLEKPVGVDVPGCKKVMALGERAKGKVSLAVGFQIRHASPYVELARRIHEGQIGQPVTGQIHYFASAINRPDWPNASPAGAPPAQLDPRQGHLRRHHRGAERPHHRRHELVPEGPPGEGGRLGRARRTHGQGRRLEPLQLRLHLPGRRAHQLRLHPVHEREVGRRRHAVLRDEGLGRGPLRRAGAPLGRDQLGVPGAREARRPPTPRRRSPAPSGAPSTTPTPTSRRRSSRASPAASSSTRPSRARSRRSPASSAGWRPTPARKSPGTR